MEERHENEQYFFDERTVSHLAEVIQPYPNPCCLVPTVGRELERRGIDVRILDIDERFKDLCGFRHFDLGHPVWLGEKFGVILFDPPFFNATPVAHLLGAIQLLSGYEYNQKLLISWLVKRRTVLLDAFAQFSLEPTGYRPGYISLANEGKNEIEFFGNLGEERHQQLVKTT